MSDWAAWKHLLFHFFFFFLPLSSVPLIFHIPYFNDFSVKWWLLPCRISQIPQSMLLTWNGMCKNCGARGCNLLISTFSASPWSTRKHWTYCGGWKIRWWERSRDTSNSLSEGRKRMKKCLNFCYEAQQ